MAPTAVPASLCRRWHTAVAQNAHDRARRHVDDSGSDCANDGCLDPTPQCGKVLPQDVGLGHADDKAFDGAQCNEEGRQGDGLSDPVRLAEPTGDEHLPGNDTAQAEALLQRDPD